MNYRHAFHAGNFADVVKHAVLTRVIEYMKRKDAPFRVIDTHAGCGRYDLQSVEAGKTGEWEAGIGRLIGPSAMQLAPPAATLLQPYLAAVDAENGGSGLRRYPGSPRLALRLMRPQDRLIANELHPDDARALKTSIGRDRRARAMTLDAWVVLRSVLPPMERRGIVLIDPPFEEQRELERITKGLADGLQRFATGTYLAWYPIKDTKPIERWQRSLGALGSDDVLALDFLLRQARNPEVLNGCGLIVVNPPYTFYDEMQVLMPELVRCLGEPDGGHYALRALTKHNPHARTATKPKTRSD